jgi:hypothetical protein
MYLINKHYQGCLRAFRMRAFNVRMTKPCLDSPLDEMGSLKPFGFQAFKDPCSIKKVIKR